MAFIRSLFIILLIAAIASPFAAGMVMERRYNAIIEHLNAANNGKIKFTGKFNKGFLKSTATTQIDGAPGTNSITLEHTIQQGPVIVDFQGWAKPASYIPKGYGLGVIDTKITGDIAQKINNLYAGKDAYSIKTTVAFNGDTTTEFTNYPLSTNLGKGALNWQGITGTAKANKDFTTYSVNMVMPLYEYKESPQPDDTQTLKVTNIKLDFNNAATSQNNLDIAIESLNITDAKSDLVDAKNLTFNIGKTVSNNLMNFDINAGFASVNLHGHQLGPFSMVFNGKNMDVNVLSNVMKTPAVPMAQQNSTVPVAVPVPAGMNKEMMLEFLKSKPSFDASVKLKTDDGDVDLTSHLEIGAPNLTGLDQNQVAATIVASKKLQISDKLFYKLLSKYGEEQVHDNERLYFMNYKNSTIPNPYSIAPDRLKVIITNWVNSLVTQLKAQNFITEKDGVITIDASYANSTLTINGAPKHKTDIDNLIPLLQVPIPNAPATLNPAPATNAPAVKSAPATTPSAVPGTVVQAAPNAAANSTENATPTTPAASSVAPAAASTVAPAATATPAATLAPAAPTAVTAPPASNSGAGAAASTPAPANATSPTTSAPNAVKEPG